MESIAIGIGERDEVKVIKTRSAPQMFVTNGDNRLRSPSATVERRRTREVAIRFLPLRTAARINLL
jgi:hypothetical protein